MARKIKNKYCHGVVDGGQEEERCPGWSMRLRLLGLLQSRCLSGCFFFYASWSEFYQSGRRQFPVTNFRIKPPLKKLKSEFSNVYILQETSYCVSGVVNSFQLSQLKRTSERRPWRRTQLVWTTFIVLVDAVHDNANNEHCNHIRPLWVWLLILGGLVFWAATTSPHSKWKMWTPTLQFKHTLSNFWDIYLPWI